MPINHDSSFVEHDRTAHDMRTMLDQANGGFDLLNTLHYNYYQTQVYDNLMKNLRAYAIGSYAAKADPYNPRDEKVMLKRTKELRDGFVFGLGAISHHIPFQKYDDHLSSTLNVTMQTIFQEQTDREFGIQMLEEFGNDIYDMAFGELSSNPANSFRWFVSELAMDLYTPNQRDINTYRFRCGVGLAHSAYVSLQQEYDQKLAAMTSHF